MLSPRSFFFVLPLREECPESKHAIDVCSFDVHFRNIPFTFNPRGMKERWRSPGIGWILNSADCSSKPRRSNYPGTACVLRVEKSSGTAEGCKEKGKRGNIPKGTEVMRKPNASNILTNRLHIPIAKQAYSESGGSATEISRILVILYTNCRAFWNTKIKFVKTWMENRTIPTSSFDLHN